MCGIFGFLKNKDVEVSPKELESVLNDLFKYSESRGKEAAGLAVRTPEAIEVYKQPVSASQMIRQPEYKQMLSQIDTSKHLFTFGHSRLVTNGSQISSLNNQPVIKQGLVGIHNGIIVNSDQLWEHISTSKKELEIDTEALLGFVADRLAKGVEPVPAIVEAFNFIEGNASIGVMFDQYQSLILATNTGSLYYCRDRANKIFLFASERFILMQMIRKNRLGQWLNEDDIFQLHPNQGCVCDTQTFDITVFDFASEQVRALTSNRITNSLPIHHKEPDYINSTSSLRVNPFNGLPKPIEDYYYECKGKIQKIRRCTKCILPGTMPYISFNQEGVCNFCTHHIPFRYLGQDQFQADLDCHKREAGKPDVIVSLSGGRDSCYALHYLKKVCGMNPIAYTYDWGMVTDIARRNAARMCGKLGIEHIIVSADITWKRGNVHRNVSAWLKKPTLGTIPLFMAGDKQYFYYARQMKKQNGIDLVVMAENRYERTKFKTGFSGTQEKNNERMGYDLTWQSKAQLMFYYAKQFILNPNYINRSLLDSFWAFFSYYNRSSHDYLNMFDYIPWVEDEVNNTLIQEYNWEIASDTQSTWRIGDGTAAFYNYIYYLTCGFTENDTFRSNQIREGILSRDEALRIVEVENYPRYATIDEYCQLINIPLESTLTVINQMPKLY